jgi:Cof subfamily protein (haloacid dehalogenase superfamily)
MVKDNLDIKLIALDMDGTLLNSRKEISSKNFQMLNRAIEKNINIVPATGRPLCGIPKELINNKGIKYAICSNGASIINIKTNEVIYYCILNMEKVISIIKRLSVIDPILDIFADGKIITEKRNFKRMDGFLIPDNMKKYIYDTRTETDDIIEYVNKEAKYIEKINLFFKDINQRKLVGEELYNIEGITITSSLNNNMEVNNEKANKGEALLWLSKYLKLSKEQVMACGDSENDLPMLKAAGLGVAMANASEEIKNVADYISSSNDEDGIAAAIKYWCQALTY